MSVDKLFKKLQINFHEIFGTGRSLEEKQSIMVDFGNDWDLNSDPRNFTHRHLLLVPISPLCLINIC